MGFEDEMRRVAEAHIEEIEGDLDGARRALAQAQGDVADLARRVALLEVLVAVRGGGVAAPARISDGLTLHEAMVEVLRGEPHRMLRAGDLAREIERRGLYRMRDGRPVESQQIHARVNHYHGMFTKEGTFIKLLDDVA